MRSNARAVVSSVGPILRVGTARQWRQLRLHALVVSQNTSRNDGVIRNLHRPGTGHLDDGKAKPMPRWNVVFFEAFAESRRHSGGGAREFLW
jgi:hypothetical protein